jgi:D-3-phosphoglycerate dehydrogenase / 2-oxoglutarate reductase
MKNKKPKILISAPYFLPVVDQYIPIFEQSGMELIIADVQERLDEQELLELAGQYNGTICGDDKYTEQVLEACSPRLKVISKWGTGIDSIDQVAAEKLGIQVSNTPNAFTMPVADSVMGYILAFARQQPWLDRAIKSGVWKKIPGRSLSETTLGVIGVGNCGKAVIRRARAFGMELLGNDIIEIAPDFILEYGVEMVDLETLLRKSDFVSLNCDLNPTSFHLINKNTLNLMKSNGILINTARGPIVDELSLIEALKNKTIAGAALDVFEYEPIPNNSELVKMDNVMLAPHNANSSPAAWERVHKNTIKNLFLGLGMTPPNL